MSRVDTASRLHDKCGVLSILRTAAIFGVEAYPVSVEVDVSDGGLPAITMVGLPDASVRESRDRVQSAIRNSGFEFPRRHVTVNLSPADIRKVGSAFDLPIALGVLAATGLIPTRHIDGTVVLGPCEPGEWNVSFRSPDRSWVWVRATPVLIAPSETVSVEVEIKTVARTVRFLDASSGAPLADREVRWTTGVEPVRVTATGRTDDGGRLELRLPRASVVFHLGPEPDGDAALVDWSGAVDVVRLRAD